MVETGLGFFLQYRPCWLNVLTDSKDLPQRGHSCLIPRRGERMMGREGRDSHLSAQISDHRSVIAHHLYKPSPEVTVPHMVYFRPLELEMDMEAATRGVPIIAVMLVLPNNISHVVSHVVMIHNQMYLS